MRARPALGAPPAAHLACRCVSRPPLSRQGRPVAGRRGGTGQGEGAGRYEKDSGGRPRSLGATKGNAPPTVLLAGRAVSIPPSGAAPFTDVGFGGRCSFLRRSLPMKQGNNLRFSTARQGSSRRPVLRSSFVVESLSGGTSNLDLTLWSVNGASKINLRRVRHSLRRLRLSLPRMETTKLRASPSLARGGLARERPLRETAHNARTCGGRGRRGRRRR